MSRYFRQLNVRGGFTMIEMAVTLGIVIMILSIMVSGQSKYVAGAALTNTADDIEINLRTAQVYGSGVKAYDDPGNPISFDTPYGITLRSSTDYNKRYILFADRNKSRSYDGDWAVCAASECIQMIDLPGGIAVSGICFSSIAGTETCSSSNNRSATITFERASTKAELRTAVLPSGGQTVPARYIKITVMSEVTGNTRSIYVYVNNQITVQ